MSLFRHLVVALSVCLPLAATAAPVQASAPTPAQPANQNTVPEPVRADLQKARDGRLQHALEGAIANLGLRQAIASRQLSVALVDLADPSAPRFAGLNDSDMVYSASLPKIAILLGAFSRLDDGSLKMTPALRDDLYAMIRRSSNHAATRLFNEVGPDYIASVLSSKRYDLYDRQHGGGLWVGKPYGPGPAVRRDPLFNLSHGASAYQVARFYYLLETGQLVSPEASQAMKEIMGQTAIRHKFVKAIKASYPQATIYRKSGTWRNYHCDSALVEHDGKRYIIVGLSHASRGAKWLEELALAADKLIAPGSALHVQ